ncbi:MAG: helix-turn-helix domain-containing protein [Balneolaceae bacterium]
MAMEKETEERIFEAAQHVFQLRGYEGARMQEIADEAGINKSMLHYYFRNKSALFQEVFKKNIVL